MDMKKLGALIGILLIFTLMGFVTAADNTSTNSKELNFDKGFVCLESQLKEDCSGAKTIEELSFSIMASPANLAKVCLEKLKGKRLLGECFGDTKCNVKDTALAILALNHAGEDTAKEVAWLISKNQSATDLIWYLQQNSDEKAECTISYDKEPSEFSITAYENKKLSNDAGSCLDLAFGSYWLKISPSCYDQTYNVECDQAFSATLFYKQKNSKVYYILDNTPVSPALGKISISPKSFCFGDNLNCDYESTAWASVALLKTGNSIEEYLPYLIAVEDTNKNYLPKAFNYMLTEEKTYAQDLIKEKGALKNYWLGESTNSKYYDTALAYLAISGFDKETDKGVRDWFGFSQDKTGCWGENNLKVRDTAITLWALENRNFVGGSTGGDLPPRCESAGFYCIQKTACDSDKVLGNYWCNGLESSGIVCCEEGLNCESDLKGEICETGYSCDITTESSVEGECCTGTCLETVEEETDCSIEDGICKSSCSKNEDSINEDCGDFSLTCCVEKESSNLWWILLLIILILLTLGAIGWIYRKKIKLFLIKMKNKMKKNKKPIKNSQRNFKLAQNNGLPPRPGFPPIRRMPIPQNRMRHKPTSIPSQKSKKQLNDTFSKLKDMSK